MYGKVCLVTGATSGIGAATAFALAHMGATAILVGRDRKKCERSADKIKTTTGNTQVEYLLALFQVSPRQIVLERKVLIIVLD